ncbi:hypothetical protein BB561_006051 [Smittium simulii]|uniref:ubiquitinyl hydrolase 1 n=1 Tax=Smittium simulii TaxID=133385 RepID=A0A2T9Y6T1_9FUNG|nr:hypothetical protein BB561_006051 [Smittium simulii]
MSEMGSDQTLSRDPMLPVSETSCNSDNKDSQSDYYDSEEQVYGLVNTDINTATSTEAAFQPYLLLKAISNHSQMMADSEQQDAQEAFQLISTTIREEHQALNEHIQLVSAGLKNYKLKKIQNPFIGLTASRLTCTNCLYTEAVRHFSFDNLSLTLPVLNDYKLEDALSDYISMEELFDVVCRKCTLVKSADFNLKKLKFWNTYLDSLKKNNKLSDQYIDSILPDSFSSKNISKFSSQTERDFNSSKKQNFQASMAQNHNKEYSSTSESEIDFDPGSDLGQNLDHFTQKSCYNGSSKKLSTSYNNINTKSTEMLSHVNQNNTKLNSETKHEKNNILDHSDSKQSKSVNIKTNHLDTKESKKAKSRNKHVKLENSAKYKLELAVAACKLRREEYKSVASRILKAISTNVQEPIDESYLTKAYSPRSVKQSIIAKPPNILCLHLARSTISMSGFIVKNTCKVEFPEYLDLAKFVTNGHLELDPDKSLLSVIQNQSKENNADLSCRYVYRLQSVIVHFGSHSYGHFITLRRKPDILVKSLSKPKLQLNNMQIAPDLWANLSASEWYIVSDEEVQKANIDDALNTNPYLLFYERILS